RGRAAKKFESLGAANRRGTIVRFKPDPKIFGNAHFSPRLLYRMARSKAYLFRGIEIRWKCAPSLLKPEWEIPADEILKFPGGLLDFLKVELGTAKTVARLFLVRSPTRTAKARANGRLPGLPESILLLI